MADVSPPSPLSPEYIDHDDHSDGNAAVPSRNQRRRPTPDRAGGRGGGSPTKERTLMELMSKAAAEIRVERRKVRQLLEENAALKDENKALRSKQMHAVRHHTVSQQTKEATEARQRYEELLVLHKAQTAELERCKEHLGTYQTRCREQQRALMQAGVTPSPDGVTGGVRGSSASRPSGSGEGYARSASATTYAARHSAARAPSATPKTGLASGTPTTGRGTAGRAARGGGGGGGGSGGYGYGTDAPFSSAAAGPPPRASTTKSPPSRRRSSSAAAEPNNQRDHQRSSSSVRGRRSLAQPGDVNDENEAPQVKFDAMQSVRLAHQTNNNSNSQHVDPIDAEAAKAAAERQFNDQMLSRLRRAIAPPPTKEQLAEVVHAMVQELLKAAARSGVHLELRRAGPCLYDCGKRRLHLGVDSRRLVVKSGGGHVDMNEYIQRHRLWTKQPANAS